MPYLNCYWSIFNRLQNYIKKEKKKKKASSNQDNFLHALRASLALCMLSSCSSLDGLNPMKFSIIKANVQISNYEKVN